MLENAFEFMQQRLNGFMPDTAVILGSGLGLLTAELENPIVIPYHDVPNFPQTTAIGHKGCFYAGKIGKHNVLFLQGRFHLYEGLAPNIIAEIVAMLKKLGVKQMLITNAAGSLRLDMPPGSLMLIEDHINFSGRNPLIGFTAVPSFVDMSAAYDSKLRRKMQNIALHNNIKLFEGVYIMVLGPNYETPSEIKLFKNFGADAVGMSTVPEVLAAAQQGIKVLGISSISNYGTGLTDKPQNHEDVMITVAESIETLSFLIRRFLEEE